jgi:nucleoside-diphosphate-sugar epimerase
MANLGDALNQASVLVTGAEGYLGKQVSTLLQERNVPCVRTARTHQNHIIGCDLTSYAEVIKLLDLVQPEYIIHCAAAVPKSAADYMDSEAARDSLLMAENLANAVSCPVIFISSMTVYCGLQNKTGVYSEKDTINNPSGDYAISKLRAEMIFAENCRKGFIALRLPGLFGPPRQEGLLYNVAKAFIEGNNPVLNTPFPLWAGLDVRDAAEICVASIGLDNFPCTEVINIGYNEVYSVHAAIRIIADICNVDYTEIREGPKFKMDLSRQEKYFGLFSHSFRQRLERFVEVIKINIR